MLDIKDAVAVITGGASGFGLALAKFWAEHGGKVVIGDVAADTMPGTLNAFGDAVVKISCDVTREEDCTKLAQTAIDHFGRINLVAPFAGIILDGLMVAPDRKTGKVAKKMSLAQFQKVVDINLTGVFLTIRECAEQMINHHCKGLICLVSSTGSLGTAGQINYSSTKAAMSVIPKVLTAEFFRRGVSDKIRVNAIAPGYCQTPMLGDMNQKALDKILSQVPIGRVIDPLEVVSLITELYRNEALAGEVYFIHGGLRLGSTG